MSLRYHSTVLLSAAEKSWVILLLSTSKHPNAAVMGIVLTRRRISSACVCVPFETPVAAELVVRCTGECWWTALVAVLSS